MPDSEKVDYSEFWSVNEKSGAVSVSHSMLTDYLETFGFGQFYDDSRAVSSGSPIRVDFDNHRIYPTNDNYAQRFINDDIVKPLDIDEGFDPSSYKQLNIHRDTKNRCSIPFQNGVVVITRTPSTSKDSILSMDLFSNLHSSLTE